MSNHLMHFDFHGSDVRLIVRDGEPWWVAEKAGHFIAEIPKKLPSFFGCVYAVEYGGLLKIGFTTNPKSRFTSLGSLARNYGPGYVGRAVLSRPHTNYLANEKSLHTLFSGQRQKGELFSISVEQFLDRASSLQFLDDSAEREKRSKAAFQFIKGFITGENELP